MAFQNIFYGVGIFFLFFAIGFFAGTFLEEIPSSIKALLLFLLAIILFILGDYLRRCKK